MLARSNCHLAILKPKVLAANVLDENFELETLSIDFEDPSLLLGIFHFQWVKVKFVMIKKIRE